jgi:hypothetical protein
MTRSPSRTGLNIDVHRETEETARQPETKLRAEYMAGAAATREGMWLRTLLSELGMGVGKIVLMCDNQSALKLMNNPVSLARTKHIDVLYHFVRDRVARGDVCVKYCDTGQMVADSLTKPLPENEMQFCREAMGLTQ